MQKFKVKKLGEFKDADGQVIDQVPRKAKKDKRAAGFDLVAIESMTILGPTISRVTGFLIVGKGVVRCGFAMELPTGYEAQIRPRSGLATKNLLLIPNSPGTIDEGYRGEIVVCFANLGSTYQFRAGDRIAQMLIKRVEEFEPEEVDELSSSERGQGGFGSTGTR